MENDYRIDTDKCRGIIFSADNTELFKYNSELPDTHYSIPEGVVKIHESAFEDCTLLQKVSFPMSLRIIASNAFRDSGLREISIPASVVELGGACFYGCNELRQAYIHAQIKELKHCLFLGCDKLEKVVMSNQVEKIGEDAFWDCRSLSEITWSRNLIEIDTTAFHGCDSLISLTLPLSLRILGWFPFQDCTSLRTVKLPFDVQLRRSDYPDPFPPNVSVIRY